MLKLLERNIASVDQRLVLLAPRQRLSSRLSSERRSRSTASTTHLCGEMQRLRGGIYLEDGAIARSRAVRRRSPSDPRRSRTAGTC